MTIFHEVPSGFPVQVPIFHTIITGITQHGKTEALKTIIEYLRDEGFTILIIDVKDKTIGLPDFAEFPQIPIYMKEVTEPLALLGLLESDAGMPLRFQFTELIRACQTSKSLVEIRDKLDELIKAPKVHPVRKDKAEVLKLMLDRLIEEMRRTVISKTLDLRKDGINVMNLANQGFSNAFKQLVVRTVIQYVRLNLSHIIVVFDEAHIQIPQDYSSASKEWVVKTIKEGASSQQFLIIADQTLKEVAKDVVTQCPIKMFGGQPGGFLEAQRTIEYIPVKQNVNVEAIMRLPLGHFYVCTREWTKLCYLHPRGIPEEMAIKVAKGELRPEAVRDYLLTNRKEGDDEMYREKYDQEVSKTRGLESEIKDLKAKVSSFEQEGTLNKEQVDELLAKTIEELTAIERTREQDYQRTIDSLQTKMAQIGNVLQGVIDVISSKDIVLPSFKSVPEKTVAETEDIKPVSDKPRRKTRAHAGSAEEPKNAPAWIKLWWPKLEGIQQRILKYLVEKHPAELTKSEIGFGTGYVSSGGSFNQALSQLVRWKLVRLANKKYKVVEAPP